MSDLRERLTSSEGLLGGLAMFVAEGLIVAGLVVVAWLLAVVILAVL